MSDVARDKQDGLFDLSEGGDEQYARWNEALGRWFFHPDNDNQAIRLSVDPVVLYECYGDCHGEGVFENDEEARVDFLQAVARELRDRPVAWKRVKRLQRDQLPDFIGLLCVQVLAVSELGKEASEDSIGPNNYWERLLHLLPDCAINPTSAGFLRMHQDLWRSGLQEWANAIQAGSWGTIELPADKPGTTRRHVCLPYSQALLRTTDIQAAVSLLHTRGFQSHREVSLSYLSKMFLAASVAPGSISRHACRVILDEQRRPLALEQIQNAFLAWDGTADSLRRSASRSVARTSELLIGYNEKLSRLQFQIEQLKTGATTSVPMNETGVLLGADGVNRLQVGPFTFRPRRRSFLLAVRSSVRGTFITQQKAGVNESALLLIPESDLDKWVEGISDGITLLKQLCAIDTAEQRSESTEGVPSGWAAIVFAVDSDVADLQDPWSFVIDLSRTRLKPVGGAKLDRSTWMAGAGPNIRIQGGSLPAEIDIDGIAHPVRDGIVSSDLLSQPGVHTVELKSQDWKACAPIRITTREAQIYHDRLATAGAWNLDGKTWPVFDEQLLPDEAEDACLIGVQLIGTPAQFRVASRRSSRQKAIELMTSRLPLEKHHQELNSHPIVQALMLRSRIEIGE